MNIDYVTLEQNLCSAKIFLNIFDLVLENKKDINQFTKLKIFDRNSNPVGILSFENESVKIKGVTNLGTLEADYNITDLCGIRNQKYSWATVIWTHEIKFIVDGEQSFSGNMQIAAYVNAPFGNDCRLHTTIKYLDKDNKTVELKIMDDGTPFSYEAWKENFNESLEINPWSKNKTMIWHSIERKDDDKYIKTVCYDEKTDEITTHSLIIEGDQIKEDKTSKYKSVGKKDSIELTIQQGVLMQAIDTKFSIKIVDLINLFKNGNVSFLENLIDVAFNTVNEAERKALFGTDIKRINYHNGANNLLDAYFCPNENNHFLSRKKVLN